MNQLPLPARPSRSPHNRALTEAQLIAAVGEVLARDGIASIGVNAIAKQARIDKVLIYRYFGGLPELLRAWGKSGQFWPTIDELLRDSSPDFFSLPLAERYAQFFEYFVDSMRKRPLTIEILAGEISQRNALTEILEAQREAWGMESSQVLAGKDILNAHLELMPLTNLLIAGVLYLLVRARNISQFGGINIQSDQGWVDLKSSVRHMAQRLFDNHPASSAI